MSAGKKLSQAIAEQDVLQIVGTVNAYSAILAKDAGHKAIYLSGAGVANASYGLPDLGITTLNDVLIDVRRITSACDLPLLVDADTGWGHGLNIGRCVQELIKAGAAGLHIEDQVQAKRCGHRPNKSIVSQEEMVARIKVAVDHKTDPDFMIIARTDALANEGIESAIARSKACVAAGADGIFAEAVQTLEEYQQFTQALNVPVLANITEFGRTPLFSQQELADAGVKMILYPLSAFRAMSKAALTVYETILQDGTQEKLLAQMQTREELYQHLNYHAYEKYIDSINKE